MTAERPSDPAGPGHRATLVELATMTLREEVLSGQLSPGTRIHLNDTAARLDMSPIPIREALRVLAAERLVDPLPQRGYRVRRASLSDLEDTYALRQVLDSLATRQAVPNLDAADLEAMSRSATLLLKAIKAGDDAALRRHHRNFHFRIYQAARSPWLLGFITTLWENSIWYQRMSMSELDSDHRAREHVLILKACRNGDAAGAESEMRHHLSLTFSSVRSALALQMLEEGVPDGTSYERSSHTLGQLNRA